LIFRKFFAGFFVLLIVLPFTEPWPTCPLMRPDERCASQALLVASQPGIGTRPAISIAPGSAEPDVANPITLLPPPRTQPGTLKIRAASAPRMPPTPLAPQTGPGATALVSLREGSRV